MAHASLAVAGTMTRHESNLVKGVAIMLMFAHHLFGLPSLVSEGNAPVPLLGPVPLEYWLGRYGKACVGVFLFVAGYGLALKADEPARYFMRKVLGLLIVVWIYFAIFVPIGILFHQDAVLHGQPRYALDAERLLLNFLTIRYDYNYEWWFAQTYILLVLLTPFVARLLPQPLLMLGASFFLFGVGAAMDVARIGTPLLNVPNLLIWQLPFVMGMLAARWVPDPAAPPLDARVIRRFGPAIVSAIALGIGFAGVEALAPWAMTPYLIATTPLSMVVILSVVRHVPPLAARGLGFLGERTLGLWLVHTFYCYYFIQDWVYAPRLSILVFANLLAMSLATVLAVDAFRSFAGPLIRRSLSRA